MARPCRILAAVAIGFSPAARAYCELLSATPQIPLPTMDDGQKFRIVATDDCTMLAFRAQGGTLTKEPMNQGVFLPGSTRYSVALTETEWRAVEESSAATFTWTVTATFDGRTQRLTTINEIDADRDGWTRSDGDLACDFDAARNPGLDEICDNGIDDDCDGVDDSCGVSLEDADLRIEGVSSPLSFPVGIGVATSIADLDGDGVADLLLGESNTNHAYVVYGAASGVVRARSGAVLGGPVGGGWFGWGVAAGDANGDGVADAVVGAPDEPVETAYLFLGPITGSRDASTADALLLGRRSGLPGTTFPGSTNLIGPDLDGDTQPDIVVAATEYGEQRGAPDRRAPTGGAVYVVPGDVTGAFPLDQGATYQYTGVRSNNELGVSLQALGDWNGDGIDDLAVGSRTAGSVYILDGGGREGSFVVDDAAWAVIRDVDGDYFGISLGAADYDGDGNPDLFAGAPGADGDSVWFTGAVTAFLGPFRGPKFLEDADTTWEGMEEEPPIGPSLGWSVAADDFDGDGATDVAMSANHSVYVQLGEASGHVSVAALLRLGGDDGIGGVTSVPDWTGDGAAELCIGSPGMPDASGETAGAAYVFFSDTLFP